MIVYHISEPTPAAGSHKNQHVITSPPIEHVRCQNCPNAQGIKQRSWFDDFQTRTGTKPMGLEGWSKGTSTFKAAAQYSLTYYWAEAQERAQRLERDLQPLTAGD